MELKAQEGSKSFPKKPHVKKGYYKGELLEVKPWMDKDGNLKEGMYGRQMILLFRIYNSNNDMFKNEDGTDLVLASKTYSEYKQDDGTWRTALTPNSRTTKVFTALGWTFGTGGLNTDDFVGKFVELNVDDYDAKDTGIDGAISTYKASCIKDINKWVDESVAKD